MLKMDLQHKQLNILRDFIFANVVVHKYNSLYQILKIEGYINTSTSLQYTLYSMNDNFF